MRTQVQPHPQLDVHLARGHDPSPTQSPALPTAFASFARNISQVPTRQRGQSSVRYECLVGFCHDVTNDALVRSPQGLDDAEKRKKLKVTELQHKLQLEYHSVEESP